MSRNIDLELPKVDRFSTFLAQSPSSERMDTCYELTVVTGLTEVVICPIVQSLHDIVSSASRGEHDDRCDFSFSPEFPTYFYPIHSRKFDIEYDDIIVIVHCLHIPIGSDGS